MSFVVFATTLFALAQSTNSNSLFLDSDQDGLTDQEEQMIGTDPFKADTDGDGYSDGKEVRSGYNPLKAAPGDKIVPAGQSRFVRSTLREQHRRRSSSGFKFCHAASADSAAPSTTR